MRDGRSGRLVEAMVREERLRATAGMRDASALTSWRGRSGRRYVVGVRMLAEPDTDEFGGAVVIAVQRGQDGSASLLGAAAPDALAPGRARVAWLAGMRAQGATEMHLHRLAATDTARCAVVADLTGS